MTRDWTGFDDFLWESFSEGQPLRELRLSREELHRLESRYPLRGLEPTSAEQDGKRWYLIALGHPPAAPFLIN